MLRDLSQDVAAGVHGAALVFGLGKDLGDRVDHAGRLVPDHHAHAAQPARFQPRQKLEPALFGLGEALGTADDLAVAVLVHADGDHNRDVLVRAAPAALEVDPVDVELGIFAGQGPAPPLLDRREGFLVEIGHGASRHARPPQGLADVFDAARRHADQVHLDYGFLYAGLAPFVALDHGGGEAHPFELGHLQRDLARRRCEAPLVVPCAVRGPLVCSLVGACAPSAATNRLSTFQFRRALRARACR